MKHTKKFLVVIASLFASICLASCGSNKSEAIANKPDKVTIRILHQEDYMDEELLDEFMSIYPECTVIFDKSETNETLYNELRTGKATYNLVTASEYMIQRMASEGLIRKLNLPSDSTYLENVSHYMTNEEKTGAIDKIKIIDGRTNEEGILSDYTAGYMWGTLGTLVNPYYKTYKDRGMSKDYIVDGLRGIDGWSKFWDNEYKGTHSIKDSMRDTYALGIFEIFKDQFIDPSKSYEYKNNVLFNDHSPETIKKVKDKLIDLKGNIFGFEVDSGKNDIVTGKIGMNLAWSGDAAFSILKGDRLPGPDEDYTEEKPEKDKTKLYYNIPKSGANIWFDGFAMPATTETDSKEYEYTLKFIDFISEPESVVANMSYTGFTSFISGNGSVDNPIVDFVHESFNPEQDEDTTGYRDYNISYFFNDIDDFVIKVDPDSYKGRLIVAQYPEQSDIEHLYIMEDYGKDNGRIVQMWEDIKVNPLPLWIDIFLITFFVCLIGYFGTYKIVKARRIKKRKELRNSK